MKLEGRLGLIVMVGLVPANHARRFNDMPDIVSDRGRGPAKQTFSILAAGSNAGMARTSPIMTPSVAQVSPDTLIRGTSLCFT